MLNSQYQILIVDDEPGLLYSLIAYLEDEGFRADGASSGEDALVKIMETDYDAIIVDIRLPDIDGNEVILEAIKCGYKNSFLIHTGSTDYQLPKLLKQRGFTQEDILLKPLPDLDILCKTLQKKLQM